MTSYDFKPIGVFDSGLGGLTVVKELTKLYPKESIVYLGDTARVPYGTRSVETIKEFAKQDVEFLLSKNVKAIVVACNTVSAVALDTVKQISPVPVFEVVTPAVERVVMSSKKNICVIGTSATIASNVYSKKLKKINSSVDIVQIPTPLLVPLIEEGICDGPIVEEIFKHYMQKMTFEVLVLGCTHYPLLEDFIRRKYPQALIINSGECVAETMASFLEEKGVEKNIWPNISYFFTDVTPKTADIAETFLQKNISKNIHKVHLY